MMASAMDAAVSPQTAIEIGRRAGHFFDVRDITELARRLVEVGRFAFQAMVDTLVELFEVGFAEAVKVLEALGGTCAMAANEAVLYTGHPERLGAGDEA